MQLLHDCSPQAVCTMMIPPQSGPPRSGMSERQAGWVQGSGARKRSLDGKTNSPHYGGYTTHAVESGDPPHGVIVVVVVVVVW